MVIRTYAQDSAAAAAVKSGRVDAYFGDSPVVVYDVSRDRSLAIAGKPIDATEIGIAVRRGDPLRAALQKALDVLYANGTMRRILAKWGMSNAATLLR
jgi:polar amino acid transport system substrate-binding protein